MVTTRGVSDDRERIEELEASMAVLKAHVVTYDQVRDIEIVQRELSDTLNTLSEETKDAMSIIQREFQELKAQVSALQMAIGKVGSSSMDRGKRVKVSELRRYEGARDAKELENFLFDIEQYFQAVHTDSEEDKVAIAAMYLTENAKLWWR